MKIVKNRKYKPKKLMVVAHPDDEIIFGGHLLIEEPKTWKVVSITNANNKVRSKEFKNAMNSLGISFEIWDHKDQYKAGIDKRIKEDLDKLIKDGKFKKIVTHNARGEYGHPQHKDVGKLARQLAKKYHIKYGVFGKGKKLNKSTIEKKKEILLKYYKLRKGGWLENKWFNYTDIKFNFGSQNSNFDINHINQKIPKKIHEIWIGGKLPPHKKLFIDHNKKKAKEEGWKFKLWRDKSITKKNFPLTYDYIQKAKKVGKEQKINKGAQISDLMRLEIIYNYGGFYLDSNMEVIKDLNKMYDRIGDQTMVVAPQEPCNLNCNDKGKKYIANGFFGATKHNEMLEKALLKKNLSKINFKSKFINKESGPYYFRKFINPKQTLVLPYKSIYPFFLPEWESNYIKKSSRKNNKCIVKQKTKYPLNTDWKQGYLIFPCTKYPNSYMLNHSIGGSWSTW